MTIPTYRELKFPDDMDERKTLLASHNQAEIMIKNIDKPSWYRGILFYPLKDDEDKNHYLLVYGAGQEKKAARCDINVLEQIMIRVDEEGKRARTARIFAIQRKRENKQA